MPDVIVAITKLNALGKPRVEYKAINYTAKETRARFNYLRGFKSRLESFVQTIAEPRARYKTA